MGRWKGFGLVTEKKEKKQVIPTAALCQVPITAPHALTSSSSTELCRLAVAKHSLSFVLDISVSPPASSAQPPDLPLPACPTTGPSELPTPQQPGARAQLGCGGAPAPTQRSQQLDVPSACFPDSLGPDSGSHSSPHRPGLKGSTRLMSCVFNLGGKRQMETREEKDPSPGWINGHLSSLD